MNSQHPHADPRSSSFNVHPVATAVADAITEAAAAAGHPDEPAAATTTLRGPGAAAAIQNALHTVDGAIEHIRALDEAALQLATEARDHVTAARETAETRKHLPRESVLMADGSDRTRAQILEGLYDGLEAATRRAAQGDFDHEAQPPGTGVRITTAFGLSIVELFLLIVPVTNVSWKDPTSVAYMVGLTILLTLMNDALPHYTGAAYREHREQLHAAWDTVGPQSAIRRRKARSDLGQTGAGQAVARRVQSARVRRVGWSIALAVILVVYGTLVFTRVLTLAAGLWAGPPMGLLAAGLITASTVAAPAVMAWRWSRGNKLGDQVREHGALVHDSRTVAADLAATARDELSLTGALAECARRALTRAAEESNHITGTVLVGIQVAAHRLGQPEAVPPEPQNLFAIAREARDHAVRTLDDVAQQTALVVERLSENPFPASSAKIDPWAYRSHPRPGRAAPSLATSPNY